MKKYSMTMLFIFIFCFSIGITECKEVYASSSTGTETSYTDEQLNSYEELFVNAIMNKSDSFDASSCGIAFDELGDAWKEICKLCPEMYFVNNIRISKSGTTLTVYPIYRDYTKAEIIQMMSVFKSETQKIIKGADSSWTTVQKTMYIHDYLVQNYSYDYESYLKYDSTGSIDAVPAEDFSAVGLIINKTGVCQGYALAANYLLESLGVECIFVKSDSMNHAWNMVKVGSYYYHMDITWDDLVYDTTGRVYHDYLLLSDSAMLSKNHYGWESPYSATSTKYDNYSWKKAISAIQYYNNEWYFIQTVSSTNMGIFKYNFSTGTYTNVYSMENYKWTVLNDDSSFYPNCYSGMVIMNGKMYVNSKNAIYSFNTSTKTLTKEFTLSSTDASKGWIYGIGVINGYLSYHIRSIPSSDDIPGIIKTTTIKDTTISSSSASLEGNTSENIPLTDFSITSNISLTYGQSGGKIAIIDYLPIDTTSSFSATWTSSNKNVVTVNNVGALTIVNVGSATISCKIEGITRTCSVTVKAKSIGTEFKISDKTYTGSAIIPSISITDLGKTLTSSDYSITYKNNTNIGIATAVLQGKGNYTGKITTTFKILPKPVTKITSVVNSKSAITISWPKVSNITGYKIYRYNATKKSYQLIATTTSLSYKNTGLAVNTNYKYKVFPYKNVSGTVYVSASSPIKSSTTKLNTVTGFKATPNSTTTSKLTWTKASGVTGYQIYKYNSSSKSYKYFATTTSNYYTVRSLSASYTYSFKVRTYKKYSTWTNYGAFTSAVSTSAKPKATSKISSIKYGSKAIKVSWSKVSGASGYYVYRSTSYNGTYSKIATVTSGSTLYKVNKGLTKNKKYYYYVVAYKKVGNTTIMGYCSAKTAATAK